MVRREKRKMIKFGSIVTGTKNAKRPQWRLYENNSKEVVQTPQAVLYAE